MDNESGKKRGLMEKMRHKYRMDVINEQTFEVRFSTRLSRLRVFAALGLVFLVAVAITVLVIEFTPVKELFSGFGNTDYRLQSERTALALDTAQQKLDQQQAYLDTLHAILNGTLGEQSLGEQAPQPIRYDSLELENSSSDSMFRKEVEYEDQYSLSFGKASPTAAGDQTNLFFFSPLRGVVLNGFDKQQKHYGVDVASDKNKPISATLDGTVIFAGWTNEDGYVIHLQHAHDFVSVYKHNSSLSKQVGDPVEVGETIAIIGNTGENSTGPHLHFELWHKGRPVDPQSLMPFN